MFRFLILLTVTGLLAFAGPRARATDDDLPDVKKEAPGLAQARAWRNRPLRKLPLAYRHDGFTPFYRKPPMTRESLIETFVDPLKESNVEILVWGLGPGSVFCYDTKVGEVFGAGLSEEQWALMREGDRWAHENVAGLIKAGHDPLRVAIERAHELGLKLFARLEMNHEYGPPKPDNWQWVGFVGSLNKQHPEYRIPGTVLLDFKHEQVRAFKLAILREALEAGADGLALDFAVYPPFFENPGDGKAVMTQFVRDANAMLDEFGKERELMVRVPYRNAPGLSLDWETWMKERLIDYAVPTHYHASEAFDIVIDEFVALGRKTGVRVYPTVWHALGFVTTDPAPEDDGTDNRRYDKPKTDGMFFAQAALFNRAGADGLQLGFAADAWKRRPWLDDLADPAKLAIADKHYMVDPKPHCPIVFPPGERLREGKPFVSEMTVPLRIGDDYWKAIKAGYSVRATVIIYATPLNEGDRLGVYVNDNGPAVIFAEKDAAPPIDAKETQDKSFVFDKDWWRKGERHIPVAVGWWSPGPNTIRLEHTSEAAVQDPPFRVTWLDLILEYHERGKGS